MSNEYNIHKQYEIVCEECKKNLCGSCKRNIHSLETPVVSERVEYKRYSADAYASSDSKNIISDVYEYDSNIHTPKNLRTTKKEYSKPVIRTELLAEISVVASIKDIEEYINSGTGFRDYKGKKVDLRDLKADSAYQALIMKLSNSYIVYRVDDVPVVVSIMKRSVQDRYADYLAKLLTDEELPRLAYIEIPLIVSQYLIADSAEHRNNPTKKLHALFTIVNKRIGELTAVDRVSRDKIIQTVNKRVNDIIRSRKTCGFFDLSKKNTEEDLNRNVKELTDMKDIYNCSISDCKNISREIDATLISYLSRLIRK